MGSHSVCLQAQSETRRRLRYALRVLMILSTMITLTGIVPAGRAQQAVTSATITGTVVDSQGSGISGAHVSLLAQQPPATLSATTTSDASGRFSFQGVKSGRYSLVVSVNGFQNLTRSVDTAQDGDRDLTLMLEVAPLLTSVNVQGEPWGHFQYWKSHTRTSNRSPPIRTSGE
jgi:hypothetical protein